MIEHARILLLLCAGMVLSAQANPPEDGQWLLESWGFSSVEGGQLVFSNNDKPQSVYQPWVPDVPALKRQQPAGLPGQALQPLVVSTKKKTHE